MSQFLFVSDLDNTLVGDDRALTELNSLLEQHRQRYGTKIVYATGRSLTLYRQLATEKPLLSPDGLITSVGTEIYFNPQDAQPSLEWSDILSLGWNREQVLALTVQYPDLVPQPDSEQGQFKVSYYLAEPRASKILASLETACQEQNLQVQLIYSGGKDLDILPQNADKGLAVQFLRQKWKIDPKKTVVCGDSGNDIALFQTGEERGILVGNAKSELLQWYESHQKEYHYLAQGFYAQGILEGLKHFLLINE